MTVRAWFTLSALALLALTTAFAYQAFSPVRPPALVASFEGERLPGTPQGSCWHERGDELRCRDPESARDVDPVEIPQSGELRMYADFPVQPEGGTIRVMRAGSSEPIIEREWQNRFRYEVPAGEYVIEAEATYIEGAWLRHEFVFSAR